MINLTLCNNGTSKFTVYKNVTSIWCANDLVRFNVESGKGVTNYRFKLSDGFTFTVKEVTNGTN